ncbi:Ig-like domain-containing protein [bacterium]|nr:Ig-like domain-containing protein [bacterium]
MGFDQYKMLSGESFVLKNMVFLLLVSVFLAACSPDNKGIDTTKYTLTSISVSPVVSKVLVGTTQQYTAMGTFVDGSRKDITGEVVWRSSNKQVANIVDAGTVDALTHGQSIITASKSGVSGGAVLSVFTANITELVIVPVDASQPIGSEVQYRAFAYLASRSSVDVTDYVTWSSANDAIVSIDDNGLASFNLEGATVISASVFQSTASVSAAVTVAKLQQLIVDPVNISAAAGTDVQYSATGIYSNGSSANLTDQVDWITSDSDIATIADNGLASLLADGNAQVTASLSNLSASASLTVTPATVERLQIIPAVINAPAGTSGQLILLAAYSDGQVLSVAANAEWLSDNSSVAIVQATGSEAGFAQLLTVGNTTITASFGGLETEVDVTVTDATLVDILLEPVSVSTPKGVDVQYVATGIYSDASREILDDEITWQSSNTTVAVIDSEGLASSLALGDTFISATDGAVIGQTVLSVTGAVLTGVDIVPGSVSRPAGQLQQLTALAQYSDGDTADVTLQSTWLSSDESVAFVVPRDEFAGVMVGIASGMTRVDVNYQGVVDSIPVEITAAVLTSIVVEPINASIANGQQQQYIATGIYSDNSSHQLTEDVNWQSSSTLVAVIGLDGLATSLVPGDTTISASFSGFSDQTTLTVTEATVTSLDVFPADIEAPLGAQGQLIAIATFTDGSTADVTKESTWQSTDTNVTYVVNDGETAGFAFAISEGVAQISANFGSVAGNSPVEVTPAVLVEVVVEPADIAIPKGVQQQYIATGIYSDETSTDLTLLASWQSSSSDVATIDARGVATAETEGATIIQATYQEIQGQANLTVSPASLTSIQITPANPSAPAGTEGPFLATAYYSDLTTKDVTTEASWLSSNSAIVAVSPSTGIASFTAEGAATITATFQGVTHTTTATVTPALLVALVIDPAVKQVANGVDVQYQAWGVYSDNSSQLLTGNVTWSSSANQVAAITPSGYAETKAPGITSISASFSGLTGLGVLAVNEATITQVEILSGDFDLPLGASIQLNAVAYFTDGSSLDVTSSSTWSTSDNTILSVSNTSPTYGEVLARAVGSASVAINYQGFNDSVAGTVTSAVLVRMDLQPANTSTASGIDVQYSATGIYSDNSSENLTTLADWQSSNIAVATVDTQGKANALGVGVTNVTATFSGVSAQTSLTVTEAVVSSLQITPAGLTEPAGTSGQFIATAYYSDNSSEDVTQLATWVSSNLSVVSIVTVGENAGLASLLTVGSATVTANFQGASDVVSVNVTAAVLVSIEVNPAVKSTPLGISVSYDAIGIFSDGSSSPINEDVTWQSSNTDVAVIDSSGLAFTQGVGDTVITASTGEAEFISAADADAILTVTSAIPLVLQVYPGRLIEPSGTSGQQYAIAFFSDLTAADVTLQSTWMSSDSSIVNVVASGENAGFTELLDPGIATMSASYEGLMRTVDIEVTPAVLLSIEVSPIDQSVAKGVDVQYSATGIFSDGTSSPINDDVVWKSSDTSVATISSEGLANTLGANTRNLSSTVISASFDGKTGSSALTVTDAVPISLQIVPAGLTEPKGTSGQLIATAFYTDNSSKDVTATSTWSSSDTLVVNVIPNGEQAGLATLLDEGAADITAVFKEVSDQTTVVVTAAELVSIQVDPRAISVPDGLDVSYSATGFFTDGSSSTINDDVSWISSDPDVAVIGFDGIAITQSVGVATITAALDIGDMGVPDIISGDAELTVNAATVVSIQIIPAVLIEPAGTSGQLIASATLTDGTNQDITQVATWVSSNTNVVVVETTGEQGGLTSLISKGVATVSVSYNGISASIPVEATDAVLVEILIDPINESIPEGVEQQFHATGVFSDGSTSAINEDVSWVSSANNVATIDSVGLAVGLDAGVTTISVALGEVSASTPLNVTNPVLVDIQVSPIDTSLVVKQTQQYQATGLYDNASTQDITSIVTWVTDTEFATISNSTNRSASARATTGLLTAVKITAETEITASLINSEDDLISDEVLLEITAPTLDFMRLIPGRQILPKGASSQWTAEATYTNSDTIDVTNDAGWNSDDTSVATVVKGLVYGVNAGTSNISISYEGETDTLPVTVSAPDLNSLVVTPSFSIVGVDTAEQMIATANYNDGSNVIVTDSVSWFSSAQANVSVSNAETDKGVATGLQVGMSLVSADLDGSASTDATVDVQNLVLLELKVSPRVASISKKSKKLFLATAIYNGGTTSDVTDQVTWTTSDKKIIDIENSDNGDKKTYGLASAKKEGSATITAIWPQDDSITDSADITVTAECGGGDPDSIYIRPNPATLSLNGELQFELITVNAGCETNETYEAAHWHTDDEDVASVIHKKGVATGLSVNTVNIDGEYNKDFVEIVPVTVIAEEVALVSIDADAPATVVDYEVDINGAAIDLTCAMRQIVGGVLQPEEDVSDEATWISADNTIASLVDTDTSPQTVNGVSVGKTEVTCYHGGKQTNITINVITP